MKVLILGGSGQLGIDCLKVLSGLYETYSLDRYECDITNSIQMESVISKFFPNIIVNCAAFTNVDLCETRQDECMNINSYALNQLCNIALKYNSKIIHISTDYVFDGYKSKSDYYTEYDLPNPLSYYGISKLNGEHTVLNSSKNNVVIRTSWLYGNNGHNFLKSILRKSTISKSISVVNDQYGTPTWSMDLAFQIAMIINSNFNGLCHATSQGFCTWFDLATLFFNLMNIDCDIIPCNTSDYPTIAARPKNSILENVNLKNMKIDVMPHWKSSLKRFVKLYGNNLLYEVTREQKMNKF